jgi:hypothetical protein
VAYYSYNEKVIAFIQKNLFFVPHAEGSQSRPGVISSMSPNQTEFDAAMQVNRISYAHHVIERHRMYS